jgi:transposase-like protein
MARKRVVQSAGVKAKAALAALQGRQTLAELAKQFGVHPIQLGRWRQQLLDRAPEIFEDGRRRPAVDETSAEELYAQIGRLQMEVAWLKKKAAAVA